MRTRAQRPTTLPTRNINLTDYFDSLIESSISSGRYQNASEVVRDGLRLLEQRQRQDAARLQSLREAARIGFDALERGDFVEVDDEGLRDLFADLGRKASDGAKAGPPRS